MKGEDLKKLIEQIKKYDLTKVFDTPEEFDTWLSKLNAKQIHNFNNLMLGEAEIIMFPKRLLIDENLLNCDDYNKRVAAMAKLKNGEGCWHLFDKLCSPNFLNSKGYYEDIEMISKADTARFALWVIDQDAFINSPYHKEDLKLIVETHDTREDNSSSFMVLDALATVAGNIDSIKSPYHRQDMELIAHARSECLQSSHSYPKHGLNNLAINKVSLNDKYHLENMKILAENPIAIKYLYNIMVNPGIVKGKYYRDEVEALVNAKSKLTATAIYYYIVNPSALWCLDLLDELHDCGLELSDITLSINRENSVAGSENPKYLEYLKLLNQVDDKFVIIFESLISNKDFLGSPYLEYDINLLLSITDKDIFIDLYRLMTDEDSLSGAYHQKDADLISKTTNEKVRKLLLSKATKKDSINSCYHEYDMQYIAKLDLDSIDEERYKKMYFYLFNLSGINHIEHIDRLEKLYRGEVVETHDAILEHLNCLEQSMSSDEVPKNKRGNVLSRVKRMFTKR